MARRSADARGGIVRRRFVSPAKAGQALPVTDLGSQPRRDVETLLRTPGHPGITVGHLTLRWARDCWSIGSWQKGKDRPRWKNASWHGQLDHALRQLLERSVQGDISDLTEVVERVERLYREIGALLSNVET